MQTSKYSRRLSVRQIKMRLSLLRYILLRAKNINMRFLFFIPLFLSACTPQLNTTVDPVINGVLNVKPDSIKPSFTGTLTIAPDSVHISPDALHINPTIPFTSHIDIPLQITVSPDAVHPIFNTSLNPMFEVQPGAVQITIQPGAIVVNLQADTKASIWSKDLNKPPSLNKK